MMASERIQRRLERLLNQLDEAESQGDWESVRALAQDVLEIDPDNTEAGAYLGFDRRTLEAWDKRGVGPDVVRLPSGLPAYAIKDLDAFIDRSREKKCGNAA